jgi:murein L,D-transpeptidase YafK
MEKLLILFVLMLPQNSFKETQLKNVRVKTAFTEKEATVRGYFTAKKLKYEGFHLFIRGFKKEQKLEIWAREAGKETYSLLHVYDFCALSGRWDQKEKKATIKFLEGSIKSTTSIR